MNFYSLENQKDIEFGASVYLMELDQTPFMFVSGFNLNSILYYSPFLQKQNVDQQPAQKPQYIDSIDKKLKQENDEYQRQQVNKNNNSQFHMYINDKHYIKGNIKFDLKFIANIYLHHVKYVLLTSIEDLILLVFLFEIGKLKIDDTKIIATEPVKEIGQHILDGFYKFVQKRNKYLNVEELNKNYFEESEFFDMFEEKYLQQITQWVSIFSQETMKSVIDKIEIMNYGQKLEIKSMQNNKQIILEPLSAGYGIGSCLWVFNFQTQKIVYSRGISRSQNRHSMQCDLQKLKNLEIDYFIQTQRTCKLEQSYDNQIVSFIQTLNQSLNQNKNIVIPIKNSLFLLDILDILQARCGTKMKQINIFSSSLKAVVQISNSLVDYLNPSLQNKIYMEQQFNPFHSYDQLIDKGLLKIFDDFSQFQLDTKSFTISDHIKEFTPSLFIVEDSTLRLGDTLKILELLELSSKNSRQSFNTTMVLTDPQLQDSLVTDPIVNQFKGVNIIHQPIDSHLRQSELLEFFEKIQPKNVIINQQESSLMNQKAQNYDIHYYKNDKDLKINMLQKENLVLDENNIKKVVGEQKFNLEDNFKVLLTINGDSNVVNIQKYDQKVHDKQLELEYKNKIIEQILKTMDQNGYFISQRILENEENLEYIFSSQNINNEEQVLILIQKNLPNLEVQVYGNEQIQQEINNLIQKNN